MADSGSFGSVSTELSKTEVAQQATIDINSSSNTNATTISLAQAGSNQTDSAPGNQCELNKTNDTTDTSAIVTSTSETLGTVENELLNIKLSTSPQDSIDHAVDTALDGTKQNDLSAIESQRKRKFSRGEPEVNPNSDDATGQANSFEYAANNRDIKRLKFYEPVGLLNPLDVQTAAVPELFNFHSGTLGLKPKLAPRLTSLPEPILPVTSFIHNQRRLPITNGFQLDSPTQYIGPRNSTTIGYFHDKEERFESDKPAIEDFLSTDKLNSDSALPSQSTTSSSPHIIPELHPLPSSSISDDPNISDPNEEPTLSARPKTTTSSGGRSFTFWLSVFLCTNFLIGVLFIAIGVYHIKRSRRVPVQRLAPGPVRLKITPPE